MEINVAKRIKTIRMEKGMSQTEVASRCNVSKSLISKLESNKASIHLDLLIDIAKALNVTLFELLEPNMDNKQKATIVKSQERQRLVSGVPGKVGYTYYRLAGAKEIDSFWLVIRKDALKAQRYVTHEGYEFFFIVEGKVKLKFHDEEHVLQEGDTGFFEGWIEHKIIPMEDCEQAQLILIFIHR